MKQLVAMFSPLNLLKSESLPNCVLENLMNFVAVASVSAIVLGHPFNKRVVF